MKKFFKAISIAAFIFSFLNANAQLQNTKWKGKLNVPDPVECLLYFKNDTLEVIYAGDEIMELKDMSENTVSVSGKDSVIMEMMHYKYENNELTIQKIKGGSPFDTSCVGKYKIEIKDDKLYSSPIQDDCPGRIYTFGLVEPMLKVE